MSSRIAEFSKQGHLCVFLKQNSHARALDWPVFVFRWLEEPGPSWPDWSVNIYNKIRLNNNSQDLLNPVWVIFSILRPENTHQLHNLFFFFAVFFYSLTSRLHRGPSCWAPSASSSISLSMPSMGSSPGEPTAPPRWGRSLTTAATLSPQVPWSPPLIISGFFD